MNTIKKIMFFKNISSVKLAEEIGMPRPLLSYIINGRALPVREDALKISKTLKIKPNRIWSKSDYFIKELESDFEPQTIKPNKNIKQVSFRVATDCYSRVMTRENLSKMGYSSMQDWGTAMLQQFENQLEELSNDKSN